MDKAATCITSHKLNAFCSNVCEAAATYAASRFHYEVTIEHVLIKLLECHGGDCEHIFRYFKVNQTELRQLTLQAIAKLRVGNQGKPSISSALSDWLDQSWIVSSGYYHEASIRSVALLDTLVSISDAIPFLAQTTVLDPIAFDKLRRDARQILRGSSERTSALTSTQQPHGQASQSSLLFAATPANNYENSFLSENVSATGMAGEFNQETVQLQGTTIVGRHAELHSLINILCHYQKHNPLLVGDAGVGKSTLLKGLVASINADEVPDVLQRTTLQMLDKHFLQTHIHEAIVCETYLFNTVAALKSRAAILVIEDLNELFAIAGEQGQYFLQLLTRLLAANELRIITTTTTENFRQFIEPHAELMKYIQPIMVIEPSLETAVMMLNNQREYLQRHHQIFITDEAITAAVELSHHYLPKRCLPEKALTVLDAAAACAANSQIIPPARVAEAKSQIACLEQRLENIYAELRNGITGREKILGTLQTELDDKMSALNNLQQQWQREQEIVDHIKHNRYQLQTLQSGHSEAEMLELKVATLLAQEELAELQGNQPMVYIEVNEAAVTEVLSAWTGIASQKILQYRHHHDNLAQRLTRQIIGQEQALAIIARNIHLQKIPLMNPTSSANVFLFIGSHGVGKTACAAALTEELLGDKQFLVSIDLKSFQHANAISVLCATLCAIKKQHSNAVILLEETDKTHAAILQWLSQIFNTGICRNEQGESFNFRQMIFILTTTAGCEDHHKINHSTSTSASTSPFSAPGNSPPFSAQDKTSVASLTAHPLHPQHSSYRRSFSAVDPSDKLSVDETTRPLGSSHDSYGNNDYLNVKSIEPHQQERFQNDRYSHQNERHPHDRHPQDHQNKSDRAVQDQAAYNRQAIYEISARLRGLLLQHFSPSLLACVQIVPFNPLTHAAMNEIVLLKLQALTQRLLETHHFTFHYVVAVVDFIVKKSVSPHCGAWFVDKAIEQYLLPVIAEQLLNYTHDNSAPKLLTAFLDDHDHLGCEWSDARQYEATGFADLSAVN